MGRLEPGATAAQTRDSLDNDFQTIAAESWNNPMALPRFVVSPGGYDRSDQSRRRDAAVFAPIAVMVGLLLLVACANQGAVLLARGAARRRELALRLALGASRGRMIRQLVTESVLVTLAGTACGGVLAAWELGVLAPLIPYGSREKFVLLVDWRFAVFGLMLGLLTAILSALIPAARATRLDLTKDFHRGPRSLGGDTRTRLGKSLMVAQMSMSLALLVLAGLLGRTVQNLLAVDLGFDRGQLLLFTLERPGPSADSYYDAAERIAAIPSVRGVTFSGGEYTATIAEGSAATRSDGRRSTGWTQVETHFFETYGIPVLRGRAFATGDRATPPTVVVINQALAERDFPGENPIGRELRFGVGQGLRSQRQAQIIGVVANSRVDAGRNTRSPVEPAVFTPEVRLGPSREFFAVRAIGPLDPTVAAIREVVARINPDLPLVDVRTQVEDVERTFVQERIFARLAIFLATAALVLACVGLYGMMSFATQRRTAEIGLRIALGARPDSVRWTMLRETLGIVGAGAIIGIFLAMIAARLLANLLYGLSAADPMTLAAATALLFGVAVFACWAPAKRASRVDPVVALRTD